MPVQDQSRTQNLTKSSFHSQNPTLLGGGQWKVCTTQGPDRSTNLVTWRRLDCPQLTQSIITTCAHGIGLFRLREPGGNMQNFISTFSSSFQFVPVQLYREAEFSLHHDCHDPPHANCVGQTSR